MLAIVTTHPIQYQVPIWQALAADGRVPFEVWYLTDFGTRPAHDAEFGKSFQWDIDTLSGYPYRFLESAAGATPTDFWRCHVVGSLRRKLTAAHAKAVWIQGWQVAGYWQAVHEARAAGAQVWLRGESNDLRPTPGWKRMAKKAILGQLFSRVDRFFYIGEANRRLYRAFGVPDSRLAPGPYAVDNARFAKQAETVRPHRRDVRRQWGIADDEFCVLFAGKFIQKKRPMDLVLAARELKVRANAAKVHLLFAGSGKLGTELRRSCDVRFDADAAAGATLRPAPTDGPLASFAGFLNQTEISRAYVAADCLVLPSDHGETWGLVVNEAMASGLPCIVSDACGCAEDLVGPDGTYPCGDVAALAERIEQLRQRPDGAVPRTLPSFAQVVSAVVEAYAPLAAGAGR